MKHTKLIALAMIAALLCLLTAGLAESDSDSPIGQPAPTFELVKLDGEPFRLEDQRGKVVFLNIWATWCPPCVAEMPDIQKLSEAYPDDLVIIGVSCDETEDAVRKFVEDNGYSYPIAMDQEYLVTGRLYPTAYIPCSIFIDAEGNIASADVGGLTYAQMVARYEAAKG